MLRSRKKKMDWAAWAYAGWLALAVAGGAIAQSAAPSATPSAKAAAIDIPALFGGRVQAVSPRGKAFLTGDFDGDGVADALYFVRILPKAKGGGLATDVTVADPWNQQPVSDAGELLALAIVAGAGGRKYLLHDAAFFSTPIWSAPELPLGLAKKGSKQFREFQRAAKGVKGDILVPGTEAGIDIALYWDGKKFTLFWPKEEP
jgi:hypothetical protein